MADDGQAILVVRGLGSATVSVGALSLAPEADVLFMLALVLAQRAGERVPRSELRALIWPGACEESARHTLRQALYRLHKAGLVTEDRTEDVYLDPARVDSDLTRALATDWPEHAEPREIEAAATILPGVAAREHGALSEFIDSLRARSAAQYRRAVLRRIAATRREGRWREVEHWARMCLQADPLNEEATCARAEAAAMVGAKHEALEVLDAYLRELGDRSRVIGLPVRMLKRRISEFADTTGRRVMATSAPFVGRHEQLARAQDALADARGGAASALWLIGPAGIGKSRLLREVERASRMAGWTVVRGGAHPSYADRPFALLTDVLPGLLDAPGALGAAPHALSLMRQMGTVKSDEEPLPPEEARGRQHAVYHSWVELMDAVLGETAMALLLDDVHWSDPLTVLSLARFLESRPKARLAVILSARTVPAREDGAAVRLLSAAQSRLGPLSEEEMRDFAAGAGLAGDERFDEVTRDLGRASGGNPLFLSHLVHRHQSHRDLTETPPDLASLIDGQLQGLSREATRLLQACALLGQHSSLPRIERALAVGAPALVSAFGELDDLLALPTDPGVPLAPHDLWTERVRRGMTSGVFRSLAVSVARVLEADAVADGGIDLSWDAARLYWESGEKQLAYATMMRCAEYLLRTGATSEASRAYLAASEWAVTPEQSVRALIGRATSFQCASEWEECSKTMHAIQNFDLSLLSRDVIDDLELLQLQSDWHSASHSSNIIDRLTSFIEQRAGSSVSLARAALLGLFAADNMFDTEALHRFHAIADSCDRDHPATAYLKTHADVVYFTSVGQLDRATDSARELVKLSRGDQRPPALILALRTASYPFRRAGDFLQARAYLEEALALATQHALPRNLRHTIEASAWLSIDENDPQSALAILHRPDVDGRETDGPYLPLAQIFANVRLGRWREAEALSLNLQAHDFDLATRAKAMVAAAQLLIVTHRQDVDECETLTRCIANMGRTIFQHAGQDPVAEAYAEGLSISRGLPEACEFAKWYLTSARLERFPAPPSLVRLANKQLPTGS